MATETAESPKPEAVKAAPEAPKPAAMLAPQPAEGAALVTGAGLSSELRRKPPVVDGRLFLIVTGLLIVQLVMLAGNLAFQFHNYSTGIALAREGGASLDNISLILIYSRAWDFAVVKTSALFLGFLVFYTGALYVLRSADAAYELSLSQGNQLGLSLKTSSPGLVMITCGAVLVALVLYNKSTVGLEVSVGNPGSATTITAGTSSTGGAPTVSTSTTTTVTSPAAPPAAALPRPAAQATPAAPAPAPAPARPAAPAPTHAAGEDNRVPKLLDVN
jgi:hypothetical protein